MLSECLSSPLTECCLCSSASEAGAERSAMDGLVCTEYSAVLFMAPPVLCFHSTEAALVAPAEVTT